MNYDGYFSGFRGFAGGVIALFFDPRRRPQTTRPRASGSVPISAFAGSGGVTDVTDVPFHVLLA